MCTTWNDEQWLANSNPAQSDSRYTLKDTRYSQNGQVARTYTDGLDDSIWGVLPGTGNYANFDPIGAYTADAQALGYLEAHGFVNPQAITEQASVGDLVEQFA